jgi:ribosomal protein S18 acetylase RimI-like enzyme
MITRRRHDDPDGALVALFAAYRSFYGRDDLQAEAAAFLRRRLETGDSLLWSAELEGDPVGFVQVYPQHSSLGVSTRWTLNDLFVAPEGRRLGAARLLVRQVLESASTAGVREVSLETAPSNGAARRLYESEGFSMRSAEPNGEGFLDYTWTEGRSSDGAA